MDWADTSDSFRQIIKEKHAIVQDKSKKKLDIDNRWPTMNLGDCVVINDSTYSPKESWPFINYLDTGNITENKISKIQKLIAGKDKVPSRARRKVYPSDIVYSTVRPNQKHFGLLKDVPENFLVSTGFSVIRAKSSFAHTNFIYWFLTQNHIVEHLQTIAEHSTSAYPSIRPDDIERLTLNLPPLPEQKAIANILDTLDDKIKLNQQMSDILETMAQVLFKSWFVDFDPVREKMEGRWCQGESLPGLPASLWGVFPNQFVDSKLGQIPDGWNISDFGTLVKITSGKRPSARFSETSQEANVALWGGNGPMGFVPKPLFQEPILLTGRVGTLGSVFRITSHSWPSDNTLVLIPKNSAYFEFLYFQLHQIDFSSLNRGSTQPLLTQADIKIQQLCLPKPDILQYFHVIASNIFRRVDALQHEATSLSTLRDRLLPKLLSGKLNAFSGRH